MTESITDRIRTGLYRDCRIHPEDLIVVGVSGGIDSVFLLTQLKELGQPLIAAVFDHSLRPEAAEECDFVEAYCANLGIPCSRGKGEAAHYASSEGIGIEEAARTLRYKFLFKIAAEHQAKAVATAHHANDQAETVLLHILRGSGIDGLCGIQPRSLPNAFSDRIPLIRPLLKISRPEIETWAEENRMPYRQDRSNTDNTYTRNRIRNILLPDIAAAYNPQITGALCRLAENVRDEKEILEKLTKDALQKAGIQKNSAGAAWDRSEYISQPAGIRIRMLRHILSATGEHYSEAGYRNLKDADEFLIHARQNQRMPFIGGLTLVCEGTQMMILKDPDTNRQQKYLQMLQELRLTVESQPATTEEIPDLIEEARQHPEKAILDAEKIVSSPFLRTIQEGERFDPFGLNGQTQKLSDFLINAKVPKEYREYLAAAADEAGIIWIPGLRTAHRCAITRQTTRILILKVSQGDRSLDSNLV